MEAQALELNFTTYETALEKARRQFSNVIAPYFAENQPKELLSFWIHFSSQGVGMTEPVETWIKRAGNKCAELGFNELGKQLGKHAIHEANHHLMMIEDTHSLVDQWNKLYMPQLDAEILLKQKPSSPVIAYQELHEQYITGENPYCQIAIEYEIENLAAVYGENMVNHSLKVLGEEFRKSLSFIDEHAAIDVAHTKFNRKVLSDFIDAYPDAVAPLIEAGKKALEAYGDFLTFCLTRSKDH